MNILLIAIACWIYLGRGVLLGQLVAQRKQQYTNITSIHGFALGLVISPILLSISLIVGLSLTYTLSLFVLTDIVLLVLIARRKIVYKKSIPIFLFVLLCGFLALMNGAYVEQLSDAWWHMRHIASMLHAENTAQYTSRFHGLVDWLGIDQNSYRLQALLASTIQASVLDSWLASNTAVAMGLGASIFYLVKEVCHSRLALFISLVAWLIIMGGMHTGFRLMGWPAGMGYVFLNLGLVASYQLFNRPLVLSTWLLVVVTLFGAALFHLGEVFLLALALALSLVAGLLVEKKNYVTVLATVMMGVIVVAVLYWYEGKLQDYLAYQAFLYSGLFIIVVGIAIILYQYHHKNRNYPALFAAIILAASAYGIIDWAQVASLFQATTDQSLTFYGGYIPEYIIATGTDFLRLPKWEHQLRAGILWSGIVGLVLAIWLCFYSREKRSYWLTLMMIAPLVIISSPYLFSMLLVVVPEHGAYRVQFLIPVAIVFGVAFAQAIKLIFNHSIPAVAHQPLSITKRLEQSFSPRLLNIIKSTLILCLFYIAYKQAENLVQNFDPKIIFPKIEIILVAIAVLVALLKIQTKKLLAMILLVTAVVSLAPDFSVRMGITASRPWAVFANKHYHWLRTNSQSVIEIHTSWRYQNDLKQIRNTTNNQQHRFFIADIATSYYVAAATTLTPLIQHEHHSKHGAKYNKSFVALCRDQIDIEKFNKEIQKYNKRVEKSKASKVIYIILNKDTRNYTAEYYGTSCVGEIEHLTPEISKIAVKVFEGEYLSLWQLSDSP